MTTRTIRNGSTVQVPIAIGETLKVVAVTGTFSATVTQGTGQGTVLGASVTGGSYGPYAYASMVSLVSSVQSEVDFDVAVNPAIDSDTFARLNIDPLTGRVTTLAGSSVGQESGLQLDKVTFVGDSFTAGNYFDAPVTSASRVGGIVTIVTSTDLGIDTGMLGNTLNIVPEDMNANKVRLTKLAANTYSYANAGPDAVGASLHANKPMRVQNCHQQKDEGCVLWLKSKTGGAFVVDRIYGFNGNTGADMLRRAQSGEVSFTGSTLAVLQTGYNDFVNESRTAEAVFADMKALALIAQSAGCKVIVESAMPWITGGNNTVRAAAARYNRLLANFCAGATNIRYANPAAKMVDGTNATAFYCKANLLNSDGIHPSPRGSDIRADAIFEAAGDWFKTVDRLVCSSADNVGFDALSLNVLDSAPWVNTGGTVTGPATGTAAPMFTITTNASVATAATVPARADGLGYDQQVVSTSSGVSVTSTVKIGTIPGARYAPGEQYVVSMELDLAGVVASKLRGMNMTVSAGASSQYAVRSGASDELRFPQKDFTLRVFSEPIIIPEVEAANIEITTNFIFNAAGTALTAKMGRVSMVKV